MATPPAAAVDAKQASDRDRSAGCTRQKRAVVVSLTKYPHIADHVRDAIGIGLPVILHIDRGHADEHRAASTDDLPAKRGYDRDEYPPAMSREGGERADVRYVKSSENRAAGASMGGQLRRYCNGQAFRLKVAKTSGAAAKPAATATPTPEPHVDEPVSYANCAAARAAGAAPLTTGDPGYAAHLDRDGDGVACEN
ncbi:excalibur calcium-binding domain-containing protein [Solirubrobacter soli]|uniref:excalibur calcium-binding domain-containing protein n=1 Tax=Solirubrobacter soli TaxID=363832 RepID=UPI00041BA71D|nr:excalibur calcium-binding domain-containing protein [Solirubrobacter soli]